MTQEEKDLVLKDLCARLHYGVKVTTTNPAVKLGVISGISIENKISVRTKHADIVFDCIEVKPYLRPMSSMTNQEIETYRTLIGSLLENSVTDNVATLYNFLNSKHLDYRGMIRMGLALEAKEGMYES